eukprot:TRINITY_DN33710_c0_g1_i1.p1 TRINITY_DN33710_c0_g1~~TRINITY_DN33710_c0_g1_i1.p1  ORF type:complete len:357 (-),score=61.29 TRINITY_DN33710_c0_g1_i1:102-1172(-)
MEPGDDAASACGGGSIAGASDEDGLPPEERPSREMTLSLARVDAKLYRRMRNCNNVSMDESRLEYLVRCDLSGPTRQRPEVDTIGLHATPTEQGCQNDVGHWWDYLPSSFVVRRSWQNIVKFHDALSTQLAYDKAKGYRRVKALVPKLPEKGDTRAFLLGVAATGDARALQRKQSWFLPHFQESPWQDTEDSREELDILHVQYVENRMAPYFQMVNRVLSEIPASVLQESLALRKFVAFGVVDLSRPDPEFVRKRFIGSRQPVRAPVEDIERVIRARRRNGGDASSPSPPSSPAPILRGRGGSGTISGAFRRELSCAPGGGGLIGLGVHTRRSSSAPTLLRSKTAVKPFMPLQSGR